MSGRIEDLYKALNGELEKERLRKNQEAWKWIKQNDTTLAKMLLAARNFKKNGCSMIESVTLKPR